MNNILTITLDRPGAKNALGPDDWRSIGQALDTRVTPDTRMVIIRGAGGCFSAGGDLKTMPERLELPEAVRAANLLADASMIRRLRELDVPVVAIIEGVAIGAALSLALACDIRIAASDAKLGAGFHKVGLSSDFGLGWLLPRIVGPGRAAEMLFSGRLVGAEEALSIGLVSEVAPAAELEFRLDAWKDRFFDGPALAVAATKRTLREALELPFDEALAREARRQARISRTADAREGVAAFLERRKPRFTGA
jgi:2-(1,2-epoxy-1,2-dihydrophenyl)acetyl-CoA isomerase